MKKKKILVVDNHPVMLRLMVNLLENKGHQVLTAEDGLSALDILKTYIPEVIFIDLVMPNIREINYVGLFEQCPR
jgi:CheY-like chemotaxis protein